MFKFIFLSLLPLFISALDLMGLNQYRSQNITGWLMSEKLDGVRAYWDGKQLFSRGGLKLAIPSKLSELLPDFALDGELFAGNGRFAYTQSVVMDRTPKLSEWEHIGYFIFDVPTAKGGLLARLKTLQDYLVQNPQASKFIKIIEQKSIKSQDELQSFLKAVVDNGGEGVVIREPNAAYIPGKSEFNLKYKPFTDAECKVVAHHEGSGRLKGMLGSLSCQTSDGKIFKIGSGFSDEERKNPPKIGQSITYKFQGLTKNGLPRFPVFLRLRLD